VRGVTTLAFATKRGLRSALGERVPAAASNELRSVKRLRHVVIRAGGKGLHLPRGTRLDRNEDKRQCRKPRIISKCSKHSDPLGVGDARLTEHDIEVCVCELDLSLLPQADGCDLCAFRFERASKKTLRNGIGVERKRSKTRTRIDRGKRRGSDVRLLSRYGHEMIVGCTKARSQVHSSVPIANRRSRRCS
jgi:hypothetical protein